MIWVYLSPHLDDVALSCGGLVWEQTRLGDEVEIWTVCAGDAPPGLISPFAQSLQTRWGLENTAVAIRREEDIAACDLLGAGHRHLLVPDCIYRRSPVTGEVLYASEQALFGGLHPEDARLIETLTHFLEVNLPFQAELVCPLTIGSHVDHLLTRAVAEKLRRPLWYYADYPYVERQTPEASGALPPQVEKVVFPIAEEGILAWVQSVAAYHSQISTFWESRAEMEAAIRDYCRRTGGVSLWRSGNGEDSRP